MLGELERVPHKVDQDLPHARLSAQEQAFIDGPVEQLCALVDDWQITHEQFDLPAETWRFIRDRCPFVNMFMQESSV